MFHCVVCLEHRRSIWRTLPVRRVLIPFPLGLACAMTACSLNWRQFRRRYRAKRCWVDDPARFSWCAQRLCMTVTSYLRRVCLPNSLLAAYFKPEGCVTGVNGLLVCLESDRHMDCPVWWRNLSALNWIDGWMELAPKAG